jgi:hypothetical protein
MKQLAHAMAQNDKMNMRDLMTILTAPSVQSMRRELEKSDDERRQSEQQQAEQQNAIAQEQIAAAERTEQLKLQFDDNQNIRDGAESIELGRKLILALEGQEGQEELTGAKGLVRALKENYNSFMNSADYKSGNLTPQDVQIQLKKLTLQSFGTFLGEDQSANSISDRDMRLFQLAVFGTDTLDDSLVNLLFANPERIQQSLGDLVISLEDRSNVSLQDNASYLKRINEGIAVSGPTPYDATYFNLGPDSDYTYNEETNRYQLTSNANS